MADDNQTKYCTKIDKVGVNTMLIGGCMSFVKGLSGKAQMHIIVEKNRLSNDISEEDALRWITIGNSLIFPCTHSYVKVEEQNNHYFQDVEKGLEVSRRPLSAEYKKYKYSDSTCVDSGVIKFFPASGIASHYYPTIQITEGGAKHRDYAGYTWGIGSDDFIVTKTGEVLTSHLTRVITDLLANTKIEEPNSELCISLKRSDFINGHHMLSALSFYRLLWSHLYKGVVKATLKLIDEGVDPWIAFSYSWAKGNYDPYYGFSNKGYLFNSIKVVKENLSKGRTINMSFSDTTMHLQDGSMTKDKLAHYLKKIEFKPLVLVCINSKGVKNLTEGSEYLLIDEIENPRYLISCNDGVKRYIKSSRFTLK